MPKKITLKIKAEDLRRKLNIQDGKTPIAGVDFPLPKDGKDGVDGITPEVTTIALEASKMAQVELEAKMPTIPAIVEQIPLEGERVRDSLELLTGDERLDKSAIRGLEDYKEISDLARKPKEIGGGSTARFAYQLMDMPGVYKGKAGQIPTINAAETGYELTSPGGAAVWGGITGTLGNQTDLQSALDAKQDDITGSDTRVLFFDGANSPAGDAGFTYNKTTDVATLTGGLIASNLGSSLMVYSDGASKLQTLPTSVYPSLTELSYLKGVTSSIQTQINGKREVLTGNRTYYVRTDGNDSNNGLANTAGGAFLTLQKAYNVIVSNLDLGGMVVTVQIGDGTYTGGLSITQPWTGGGSVTYQGNNGTPANVLISTTSADCFYNSAVLPGILTIKDLKVQTTTSGRGIYQNGGGTIYYKNINFGACANEHIATDSTLGLVGCIGNYAISGGATNHLFSGKGSFISCNSVTVTITNTPAFTQFAQASAASNIESTGVTFSGGATGVRYISQLNAVINTGGGGANYFPGDSAGSTATGGQYV